MPGYVQLLEHIGNRDNNRAALLASRICAGIEDPKQAIAAVLDVLHGRL